jgi:hypothetical protein
MQAQGQVVGHGLDRRPQTGKQLWVDRHGGNSMARAPPPYLNVRIGRGRAGRRKLDYRITMLKSSLGRRRP